MKFIFLFFLLLSPTFSIGKTVGGIQRIEKNETEFCSITYFSQSGTPIEAPDGIYTGATFYQTIECRVHPKRISTNTFVILNGNTVYKGIHLFLWTTDKKTQKKIKKKIPTKVIFKNGDYILIRYPPIAERGNFQIRLELALR